MFYKQKYLKYKTKYLNYKNNYIEDIIEYINNYIDYELENLYIYYNNLFEKYNKIHVHKFLNKEDYIPYLTSLDINKKLEKLTDDIIKIFNNIIKNYIDNSSYSLIPYYFYDYTNIDINEFLGNKNYGNCVAFAYGISDKLKKNNINNYFIPSTLPEFLKQESFGYYGHVVVLVVTNNEFVLFDPAFYIYEPIIIPKSGKEISIINKTIKVIFIYNYDSDLNIIKVKLKSDSFRSNNNSYYLLLNEIINPTLCISAPVCKYNKRISLVKVVNKKKHAHHSINFIENELQCYDHEHSSIDNWVDGYNFNNIKGTLKEKLLLLAKWYLDIIPDNSKNIKHFDRYSINKKIVPTDLHLLIQILILIENSSHRDFSL